MKMNDQKFYRRIESLDAAEWFIVIGCISICFLFLPSMFYFLFYGNVWRALGCFVGWFMCAQFLKKIFDEEPKL